jgi:hypothetical protein
LFGLSNLLVGGQGHVYHLVYKLRLAKGTSKKAFCPHCLITLAFLHVKFSIRLWECVCFLLHLNSNAQWKI